MADSDPTFDAVVVGAGWAGLAVSAALQDAGRRHVVLERRRVGETWRSQRWHAFRMNTPNVQTVMPGEVYTGDDPEGFMTRDDFVAMLEAYALRRGLPVRTDTPVLEARRVDGAGFELVTPHGPMRTRALVVATGNLNVPRRPACAARLPPAVRQMDGADYREPGQLPPGAVLVVGCGNSGGQIAEDIARSGRRVLLASGRNGRIPRRYRQRDIILWLTDTGRMARPRTTSTGRPLLGADHTISLQSLSAQGIVLLGRLEDVDDAGRMRFAADLHDNARFADEVSAEIRREIDAYIASAGLDVPAAQPDPAETVAARFPEPPMRVLDLAAQDVSTVVWCIGFGGDFGWLQVPGALDAQGQPNQTQCVSVPGVWFAGLDTSASMRAGTILVAADEAAHIAMQLGTYLGADPQGSAH